MDTQTLNTYGKAFAQVSKIINGLTEELRAKIPMEFIQMIEKNKIGVADDNEELSYEAQAILALIYRDFLCSEDLEDKMRENDLIELEQKYNKLF